MDNASIFGDISEPYSQQGDLPENILSAYAELSEKRRLSFDGLMTRRLGGSSVKSINNAMLLPAVYGFPRLDALFGDTDNLDFESADDLAVFTSIYFAKLIIEKEIRNELILKFVEFSKDFIYNESEFSLESLQCYINSVISEVNEIYNFNFEFIKFDSFSIAQWKWLKSNFIDKNIGSSRDWIFFYIRISVFGILPDFECSTSGKYNASDIKLEKVITPMLYGTYKVKDGKLSSSPTDSRGIQSLTQIILNTGSQIYLRNIINLASEYLTVFDSRESLLNAIRRLPLDRKRDFYERIGNQLMMLDFK